METLGTVSRDWAIGALAGYAKTASWKESQGQMCNRELSTGLGQIHWTVLLGPQPLCTEADPQRGGARPGNFYWLSIQGSRKRGTYQEAQGQAGVGGVPSLSPLLPPTGIGHLSFSRGLPGQGTTLYRTQPRLLGNSLGGLGGRVAQVGRRGCAWECPLPGRRRVVPVLSGFVFSLPGGTS